MSFHDRLPVPPDVILISKVVGDFEEIIIPVTKIILVALSVLEVVVVVVVAQQFRFHGHAARLHSSSAL
jgi:hypothetical protein